MARWMSSVATMAVAAEPQQVPRDSNAALTAHLHSYLRAELASRAPPSAYRL